MAAAELPFIVAAYLRKHGFLKALAAFSRENGDILEEKEIVDLETLYDLYTSRQVNGDTKVKKLKKTKLEDMPEMVKGNENGRDNTDKKVNGGASSEKKKKKKWEKEYHETKNILKERSKEEKSSEEANEMTGLLPKVEMVAGKLKPNSDKVVSSGCAGNDSDFSKIIVGTHVENGGGLGIQQEGEHPPKAPNKRSKKVKKDEGGEELAGSETPIRLVDNTCASSQDDGLSKKTSKKSKVAGEDETGDATAAAAVCQTLINGHSEKMDAMKQPFDSLGESGVSWTGSKKKKRKKELLLESAGGAMEEPFDEKLEKSEKDLIDSKKQSGKKRKHKDDTGLDNGISSHDHKNSMASPKQTKGAEGGEAVHECNVEKHKSGSGKKKKHKDTADDKKIFSVTMQPTGALAFKRVEADKVSFSDPRLSDNSYWAKEGADEGYGAKAQEVLGLVRGRDFRHEKTKKKRGSYRGGVIGLESHSIKFQNSDVD